MFLSSGFHSAMYQIPTKYWKEYRGEMYANTWVHVYFGMGQDHDSFRNRLSDGKEGGSRSIPLSAFPEEIEQYTV